MCDYRLDVSLLLNYLFPHNCYFYITIRTIQIHIAATNYMSMFHLFFGMFCLLLYRCRFCSVMWKEIITSVRNLLLFSVFTYMYSSTCLCWFIYNTLPLRTLLVLCWSIYERSLCITSWHNTNAWLLALFWRFSCVCYVCFGLLVHRFRANDPILIDNQYRYIRI